MIMVRLLSTRAFMVGFGTTKLTRVGEPALLWNQLHVDRWSVSVMAMLCQQSFCGNLQAEF
jgi:hypothetical protein